VQFELPGTSLNVYGTLKANGATFTSDESTPAAGDWKRIYFTNSSGNELINCSIMYGGSTSNMVQVSGSSSSIIISGTTFSHSGNYGLGFNSSNVGTVSITGSTFSNNESGGVLSVGPQTTFSDNTFTDNNGPAIKHPANIGLGIHDNSYSGNQINGMLLAGDVTTSSSWLASNSPYVLEGLSQGQYNYWTEIKSGVVLSIESGSVVKFLIDPARGANQKNMRLGVSSGAILSADGVVFTSFYDDDESAGGDTNGDGSATSPAPGDWQSISYNGGDGSLTGCSIRYGGKSGSPTGAANVSIGSGSSPTITGCAISRSSNLGIWIGSGVPSIHNNDIFTNAASGIEKQNAGTVNVSQNWWGGKGGPKPHGTGNGIAGYVAASPWSDIPFTEEGAEAQAMGIDTWCGAFGEPVNTATGSFYYNHTDVEIATKGLPLKFERTYNSNDSMDGPLGYGWSFNWQISANPRPDGDVIILRGDGRQDTFTRNPDGSFNAPAGRHDILTENPDATFSLLTNDQLTYNFNSNNRLASIISGTGQQTTLAYNAELKLETITGPAGRVMTLNYNSEGRIADISYLNEGETYSVSFDYSPEGELVSVTDQINGLTTYAYNDDHQITSVTDPNTNASSGNPFVNNVYADGRVIEQIDAEGNLITFDYSVPGQTSMTRVMDPGDPSSNQTTIHFHDAAHRLIRERDPYGNDTVYEYDAAGNRYKVTDRRGVVTRQVFDSAGNVTDIYAAEGLPEEQHTQMTYNAKNRPLTITDARGYTATNTYDATGTYLMQVDYPQVTDYDSSVHSYSEYFTYGADGLVETSTDRNGDVTTYNYDQYGYPDVVTRNSNRPAEEQVVIDYDYDDIGRQTAVIDGNSNTTYFEYNEIGDLMSVTSQVTDPGTGLPVDVITSYTYDPNGNRTSVTDPENNSTTYEYTAMDKLSRTTDALGNTIDHTYDAAYNRTATKDRNGKWTYFTYDLNNRLVSVEDPEQNVTTYGYDEEGNQTSVTDPLLQTTTTTYDGLGRATSVTEPDEGAATRTTYYAYDAADNVTSITDPALNSSYFTYDELGRLKQTTDPTTYSSFSAYDGMGNTVKSKDPRNNETLFTYNPNDLLVSVTDPLQGLTNYTYDKNANMTTQTDALGNTTLYAYDELGRITSEKVDDGSGGYLLERSYTYDKAGNVKSDTTGEGTITYDYDDVYNLTSVTDRQGATYAYTYDNNQNQLTATDNQTSKTVSYTYTDRGLIDTYTDAHGASQSFSYNDVGLVTERQDSISGQNVVTSYDYTPRNQQKSVSRGGNTTTYTYDAAGRMATKSYPNSVTDTFGYDQAGRMTSLVTVNSTETLNSYAQTYDASGNLTQRDDMRTGSSTFVYDELDRLVSENIAGYGQIGYTYDEAGNRLTQTHPNPTGGPGLTIAWTGAYWASQEDYENRHMSIDYRITNNGPGNAVGTKVTNSTASDGSYLVTPLPQEAGDISEGAYSDVTLKYYIPEGVTSVQTVVYATCKDSGGTSHYFPANRDFYTYNEANQLVSILDSDGVTTDYSYNQAGALTEKTNGTDTTTMSYNGIDKLTQVATPDDTVDYAYDALGRRMQRVIGQTSYRRLHLGASDDFVNYESDYAGTMTAETLTGADGHISYTAHMPSMSITAHHSYNPHGDTTLLTSSTGVEWVDYSYDAFGGQLDPNGLSFGYTGKWQRQHDNATKMIRMGVREYDPALGRFISTDPLRGTSSNPQSQNRYGYALNNPLTVYDLNGLSPLLPTDDWLENIKEGAQAEQQRATIEEMHRVDAEIWGDNDDRVGADRNGFGGCANGIANDGCGCKSSGLSELDRSLIPAGGTGLKVGAWSYNETNQYDGDFRLYEVSNNQGMSMMVSADNPYLAGFAGSIRGTGVAGNYAVLSGFTSWFTGTMFNDNVSGIIDEGPRTVSDLAQSAAMYYKMMEMWEQKCR